MPYRTRILKVVSANAVKIRAARLEVRQTSWVSCCWRITTRRPKQRSSSASRRKKLHERPRSKLNSSNRKWKSNANSTDRKKRLARKPSRKAWKPSSESWRKSCGIVFQRQEQLKRHIKQAHAVVEQKHESISQIIHQRQTRNMRKRRNPIVKPRFAEALHLLAHAEVHARFEPHKSNLCKRSFLNETTIKEHVQQFHSLELTETSCVVCGKLCKNHNALLKHAGNGPAMERTAAPSVANRSSTRHASSDTWFHTGTKPYDARSAQRNSAGRQSPTEEHCKSCEHNAKLTYNDLNLDKFPAGTDRRLSTSTSLPAARRLIGMFTVWMKA
ncbi:zinc finger protein [Culex quinquefasciatus]|uniref:Zinc finger protein n=1 Tax=Culex quinquefasciatus TaxID=7176 RepID=B0XGW2_CULQU|nr:zinc finger protein [Culex quinquefasciatus]|eukprot:XP_001868884.1 zinc finger protein [Culex quinquefasciatus]